MSAKGAQISKLNDPQLANTPQMLQYYESHLVFTQNDNMNGDDDDDDDDGNSIMMKDAR